MKLIEYRINDFLNAVDEATPTPGGGSVSALGIAQGLSLLGMVGKLTVSKKKFKNFSQEVQEDYLNNLEKLTALKTKVLVLVDEDTAAFNAILTAYRLPKDSLENEELRKNEIYKATQIATNVPFQCFQIGQEALQIGKIIFPYGLKSTLSDFGVGILMIFSGLRGAALNVQTNISGLTEKEKVYYLGELEKMLKECQEIKDDLLEKVEAEFSL